MSVASMHLDKALTGTSSDSKPTSIAQGTLFYETDTGAWFVYDGSAWTLYTGPSLVTATQRRQAFVGELLTILGDTRMLWMAQSGDTTTSTGKSLNQGTITWDATVASRLSALGLGYAQTFDGSANYGSIPDADIYSFGNGTTDSAFSWIALANVTNTTASRIFFSKYNTSNREYDIGLATNDNLSMTIVDESAGVGATRASSTAAAMGATTLYGGVYSAATGGATAANDMTLYQNGLVKASSATNSASYVAMENLGAAFEIGSMTAHAANFMDGSMSLLAVCQKALTASDMWAIKTLVNSYYALSL